MSGLGSWLWGTSQLDDAVDKATSELLPAGAEDIALNLEICDQIRSKSVPARDAMRALKRRLNHKNPNVQNLALSLTDVCVKNGGDLFLVELASREFMDNLVSILKMPGLNHDVKQNILRLIQNWSVAFEGRYSLSYVGQVCKTLSSEGYNFPPKDLAVANSAMVDTQTAPDWIDSDVCLRCRTPFTFTNRKHHCRNCGQVFDQACSSKSLPLPHFGITQEVRVCEGCYNKLTRKVDKVDKGHRQSASVRSTHRRSAQDLADAELQRAIQLSLQEVGSASGRPGYVPAQPASWQTSEPPIIDRSSHPSARPITVEEEDDPDLKAAIEASLREANAPRPSAPAASEPARTEYAGPDYPQSHPPAVSRAHALPLIPNYDLDPLESDAILTFSQTVEQVEAQGGRDISKYPAVNELYDKANSLRPKLALCLDDTDRKQQMLSDMHDKLSQAVKLYDQLLTEQVVRPHWRSPQPTTVPYQTTDVNESTVSGFNQWTPAVAAPYRTEPSRLSQSPLASHIDYRAQQIPEQSYATPDHSQWQHQPANSSQQYASAPAVQTSTTRSPQRQQSFDAGVAQPYQTYTNPLSQPQQTLPPVTLSPQQQNITSASSLFNTSLPNQTQVPYVSSPPPPPLQQHSHPHLSTLNRHKSVSYVSSQPSGGPPAAAPGHLARSNTIASHNRQQQQPAHAPTAVATSPPLPHFPVAPTLAPQAYPTYGPPAPTGFVPPEERKEAMLIDL